MILKLILLDTGPGWQAWDTSQKENGSINVERHSFLTTISCLLPIAQVISEA